MIDDPSPTEAAVTAFFGEQWHGWAAEKKADALRRMAKALEAAKGEWQQPIVSAAEAQAVATGAVRNRPEEARSI